MRKSGEKKQKTVAVLGKKNYNKTTTMEERR